MGKVKNIKPDALTKNNKNKSPTKGKKEAGAGKLSAQVKLKKGQKNYNSTKPPMISTQIIKPLVLAPSALTDASNHKEIRKKQDKRSSSFDKKSSKVVSLPKEVKISKKLLKENEKEYDRTIDDVYNQSRKSKLKQNISIQNKKAKVVKLDYEVRNFKDDRFNEIANPLNVQKICSALMFQVTKEVQERNDIPLFSDYRYMLQVCCYKIPSCPKRLVKLALRHPLVGTDDDVAVIVADLQRGARFDYDSTVQHYEDLLRKAGVTQRITVVPFNRLRNDMVTFESKRKFVSSYDYLLCDGRISGQVTGFLGNITQKPRNVLHAVRLSKESQLATEIARGLSRTAYRQLRKGDLITIPVGNDKHTSQELSENIMYVIQQLQQQYPGGVPNIRSMYLKIDVPGTSALPVYISMCAPPAETPYVLGPREQRMLKLKKQANEVLTKFALTKDVRFVKLTKKQVNRKVELRQNKMLVESKDKEEENKNGFKNAGGQLKKPRNISTHEKK